MKKKERGRKVEGGGSVCAKGSMCKQVEEGRRRDEDDEQVSLQHSDGEFSDCWDVDAGLEEGDSAERGERGGRREGGKEGQFRVSRLVSSIPRSRELTSLEPGKKSDDSPW